MSRPLMLLLIVLLVLIGAVVFLSSRDLEQPQMRVEKVVPLENLTQ